MDKLIIHQKKLKNRSSSFFYDGIIAEMGPYSLCATGEIRIMCKEHQQLCYDVKPRNCCCLRPKTDKDVAFGSDYDQPFWFDNNNWFEVYGSDGNETFSDVAYDYDEAIELLKKEYKG